MAEFLLNGWTLVYTVFMALFLFGVTVFVHEAGHYLVARRCGLVVKTFSIGFGRPIVKWERNGIIYKIGWIPFGGYVSLPQLDPEGMEKIQGREAAERYPEVSPWKKIAVAFFGPAGNVALAAVLAVAIWLIPGPEAGVQLPAVPSTVAEDSAAYAAGLRPGDEIVSVGGTPVGNWYEFTVETLLKGREPLVLGIVRDGGEQTLTVPSGIGEQGVRIIEGIEPAIPCLFGAVTAGSPAERAGVRRGDRAAAFNGIPVLNWEHFTRLVQDAPAGEAAGLLVEREGETVSLSIVPEYNPEYERMMIGVQLGGGSLPWMLYRHPADQLKYDALAIFRVLKALVTPQEARQAAGGLGGPVAIFDMLTLSIRTGLLNTLGLLRFLNVNLAVLNLLPVPVLDGGHILFALWHGITRRKVNAKVQSVLVNGFAALLISAMLLLTFNDIDRKFGLRKNLSAWMSGSREAVEEK